MNIFYDVKINDNLKKMIDRADELKQEIEQLQSSTNENLRKAIHDKLRYLWTYNSNAIEGNSLTLGDTIFFLKEGLTIKGKSFKDHLDTYNHAEAIDFILDVVNKKQSITPHLLRSLNEILLSGVKTIPAFTPQRQKFDRKIKPGNYKTMPNYVAQSDGSIHEYVQPIDVPQQIDHLCQWIETQANTHPIIVAVIAHYNFVRIHPFDDGNGRGARILMNIILMRHQFYPAVIDVEHRKDYLDYLRMADKGEFRSFVKFITEAIIHTQKVVMEEIIKYQLGQNGSVI